MEKLIILLLNSNHIYTIDRNDIHLQLLSHPEYPSVKSITDTFDYFGIENITANVPKDVLHQLPTNFLAIIEEETEKQLVYVSVKKKGIHINTTSGILKKLSNEQFIQQWTGTIIAIEKNEKRAVTTSLKTIKKEPLFFTFLIVSTLFLQLYLGTTWIVNITMFLALLGIITGYFITKEELGIKDKRISKLCNSLSSNGSDCGTLINSKELKRYPIPFKELVMVYFISQYLIVSILGFEVTILLSFSALSIPVVIASLYLQAFVLKQWCLLCIITSWILVAQFGVMLIAFSGWDFSVSYTLFSVFIAIWVTIGWMQVKNLWNHKVQHQSVRQDYFRFKRNENLFQQSLYATTTIHTKDITSSYALSFGNENANTKIVAITNPLCGYCSTPFETYAQLIEQYPDDIHLSVVFNTPSDVTNKATQLTLQIIALYQQNKILAWNALLEWFKEKDMESWTQKYVQKQEITATYILEIVTNHKGWCVQHDLYYTPETIINNQLFPKDPYQISDVLFFIDDLILETQKEKHILVEA